MPTVATAVGSRRCRPVSVTLLALVSAALLSAPRSSSAQTTPGVVAAYGFSEASGGTTADSSGNGLTGTLVNGPAWVTGRNGTGLSFNGASTYVDLGNPAPLRLTGSLTLSAWVYETANVADDGQIVAKSDGAGWQLKSTPIPACARSGWRSPIPAASRSSVTAAPSAP